MKTLLLLLVFVLTGCSQANCDKEMATYKDVWKAHAYSTYSSNSGSLQSVTLLYSSMGYSVTFSWGGGFGCSVASAHFPAVY